MAERPLLVNGGCLSARAGSALVWRSIQLGGVKLVFLVRILILGRLLAPEDFGLFAISLIAIHFLLSITDFGMVPALVQRSRSEDRHYDAGWTVNIVRAVVVATSVFLAAPLIADLFAEPRATDLVRVLALQPILNAAASIRLAELNRDLRFRALAFLHLSEALLNTAVSIALVGPLGVWALVAGPLAGSTAYLLLSYVLAPYRPHFSIALEAVRPLFRYGRWIFLTGVFAVTGSLVLQLVISRRLGVEELGLYFLAARLAFLPSEVIGEVVGTIAFPVYSRLQSDARAAARAFRSLLVGMTGLVVPASLLLVLLAPSLVEHVLGTRWEGTAPLIVTLALVNVVGLLGDAIVPVLKGTGRPEKQTVLELVQSVLLVVFVWVLAGPYGVLGATLAWLPAIGASQLLAVRYVRRILPEPFAGTAKPILAVAVATGAGLVAAWGLDMLLPGPYGPVAATAIFVPITATALWLLDRGLELGLATDLARVFPAVAPLVRVPRAELRA